MKAKLQSAMKEAMKAKDAVRLGTIRGLLSEIQYDEMQKGTESLNDEATLQILQRELKKRKEEVEFAEKANRKDLLDKLAIEMACIESFLPKQLSATELETIVTTMKNETPDANVGVLMKLLKDKYSGQYDGKIASEVVRKVLS